MTIISDSVGSSRWAISVVTGRPVNIDVPRSPCAMLPGPFAEAGEERPVEAEAPADLLDVLRRGLVAGDNSRRITRRDVEQAEHEQGDDPHDRDRRHDASDDVSEHPLPALAVRPSSRPRRTATGP